jgi:NAD(P)-dependent dehydrogenase (short-subunit alcohol dehydrogenase family)
MDGKIVLVTGATNGIGLVAAPQLAGMGARVIGVCRSAERGEQAEKDIRAQTGNPKVDYLCADLSSQKEVRALADEVRLRTDRLHILINNAGAFFMDRQESVDGIEMTFALNHLSYFLLTNLLFDLLQAGGSPGDPARIINTASAAERGGTLDETVLLGKAKFNGWKAYSSSKLCNITFTYELDRRRDGQAIVANALHPGFVASNFAMNNFKGLLSPVKALYRGVSRFVARSPEQGADTIVWLASSPEAAQLSGQYFQDRKPIRSQELSYDVQAAQRLWELSENLTGLK